MNDLPCDPKRSGLSCLTGLIFSYFFLPPTSAATAQMYSWLFLHFILAWSPPTDCLQAEYAEKI